MIRHVHTVTAAAAAAAYLIAATVDYVTIEEKLSQKVILYRREKYKRDRHLERER